MVSPAPRRWVMVGCLQGKTIRGCHAKVNKTLNGNYKCWWINPGLHPQTGEASGTLLLLIRRRVFLRRGGWRPRPGSNAGMQGFAVLCVTIPPRGLEGMGLYRPREQTAMRGLSDLALSAKFASRISPRPSAIFAQRVRNARLRRHARANMVESRGPHERRDGRAAFSRRCMMLPRERFVPTCQTRHCLRRCGHRGGARALSA